MTPPAKTTTIAVVRILFPLAAVLAFGLIFAAGFEANTTYVAAHSPDLVIMAQTLVAFSFALLAMPVVFAGNLLLQTAIAKRNPQFQRQA